MNGNVNREARDRNKGCKGKEEGKVMKEIGRFESVSKRKLMWE